MRSRGRQTPSSLTRQVSSSASLKTFSRNPYLFGVQEPEHAAVLQVGELVPIINCSHSADFVGLYIYDEKDEDPGFPIAFTNVDTLRLTFNYPGVRVLKVEAFNGVGKRDLVEVEQRIFIGVP